MNTHDGFIIRLERKAREFIDNPNKDTRKKFAGELNQVAHSILFKHIFHFDGNADVCFCRIKELRDYLRYYDDDKANANFIYANVVTDIEYFSASKVDNIFIILDNEDVKDIIDRNHNGDTVIKISTYNTPSELDWVKLARISY